MSKTLLLILIIFLVPLQYSSSITTSQQFSCSRRLVNGSTRFRSYILNAVLFVQSASISEHFKYYTGFSGSTPVVYASYLCRGDVNATSCFNCVSKASKTALLSCSNTSKEAFVWGDVCTFRYSDQAFYGHLDKSPDYIDDHYQPLDPEGDINVTRFDEAIVNAGDVILTKLGSSKSNGSNFATAVANVSEFSNKIYAMGECTWDLNPGNCSLCVLYCVKILPPGMVGGRVMSPSCNFRYELYSFFDEGQGQEDGLNPVHTPNRPNPGRGQSLVPPTNLGSSQPPGGDNSSSGTSSISVVGNKGSSNKVIVRIVVPVTVVSVLLVVGIPLLMTIKRPGKKADAFTELEISSNDLTTAESFQYDFKMLQAATNNFSSANKLGEGGFGGVYRGKLSNGQEIAVKRLSRSSNQGVPEFKNEIVLVAKLQHRNLVRLLGFCLAGTENLLVYEFVPNKSLDYFLFDPEKQAGLDWTKRYKIIRGVARGILYLHEDSRLRIIHRDIKASNILLDADMTPKISDFGLAKILGIDQSQGNTNRVAGTYGYMAPEYAFSGEFSESSDAYSFGVLVLEIVSGQKITSFRQSHYPEHLMSYAWNRWNENEVLDIMDPKLRGSNTAASNSEVIRCVHLGLLCVQEEVNARPSMATVVMMLSCHSVDLPQPRNPAFYSRATPEAEIIVLEDNNQLPSSVNFVSTSEVCPR